MEHQSTAALIKNDVLLQCYRQMVRIRRIEEKIAALYGDQQMRCPVHLCIGQEGISVGVCSVLEKDDYVLSNHRSHGHYLAKGGELRAMMAELYGKATGCTQGKGGSMHLMDESVGFLGAAPIVSSTIPIAVGVAMGTQMKGENRVTVTFFGEAATEEGVFHESISYALLKKLPVVFICENNLYSVYSPLSVRQPKEREVFELAKGHGLPSFQADGNHVEEVYRLTDQAVARARRGVGPTFLEFSTYRWLEHCGPNDDTAMGYRTEEECREWKKRCPITRLEQKLKNCGDLTDENIQGMKEEMDLEIEEAVTFAKQSPFPKTDLLMKHVVAAGKNDPTA